MSKTAGHYLGRAHFYRDRGAGYIDGVRTSLQVGFIGAGVLKGAGFTDTAWAIVVGIVTVLVLESAKVIGGWIDWRLGAIHVQQRAIGWETNPVEAKKIELMEAILARLPATTGSHEELIAGRPGHVLSQSEAWEAISILQGIVWDYLDGNGDRPIAQDRITQARALLATLAAR